MSLVYLSCAWTAGILVGSFYRLPLPFLLLALLPLPLLFLHRTHRRTTVLALLCIVALAGGILRYQLSLPVASEDHLLSYVDRGTVELEGTICDDAEAGENTVQLRLSRLSLATAGEQRELSGTVLLFMPPYVQYSYGDVLRVTGELSTPPRFEGFDYAAYLARQGVQATMLYPQVEVIDSGRGSPPLAWIYSLRHRLSRAVAEVLPEPHASLIQGVVLGMRGGIPDSLKSDFARSGTSHLLAISGLHLSIVAGLLLSVGTRLLGRRWHGHIWLGLGGVWLYAIITGMNPPVLRAAIMATMFLTAGMLGRQRSAVTGLTFAAAIMVGASPQTLWQVSFQLSFLAMVGLVAVSPFLQTWGREMVDRALGGGGVVSSVCRYAVDNLAVTLGVLAAVWPLIAYHFGIVSFVAPLATVLVLPALPWVIGTGTLAAVLGAIALSAGQLVAWLAWLCSSYMLVVVTGLAEIPGASIESVSISPAPVLTYYGVFAAAVWLGHHRREATKVVQSGTRLLDALPRRWTVPPLAAAAALAVITAVSMPDDHLHLSFLDVGQGDAILVQTPFRQDILVDGGPGTGKVVEELSKKMPFWDRTIDLVVLTHPDADHLTGLLEVLRRYRVRQVLSPPLKCDSALCDEWTRLVEEEGARQTIARAGQTIDLGMGHITVKVLNPLTSVPAHIGSDPNDSSVVLRVCAGQVSFLLTADITWRSEAELLARRAYLESTVLKAGHHGSETSTSREFLAVVDPRVAVISVGAGNRFGHPGKGVLERLAAEVEPECVYRTDTHGTIEFITDGQRLWVRTETR